MVVTKAGGSPLLASSAVTAVLLCAAGILLAVSAHLATKVAERRAQAQYREVIGEEYPAATPDDQWKGVRSLVGRWGCLVTVLEFVRGVGVLLAVASGLYLLTRP